MISIKLVDTEVIAKFERLPEELRVAVEAKFAGLIELVREKVEENLGGAVLQTKTGNLLAALRSGVSEAGGNTIGFVEIEPGSKEEVYGRAHEYGGKSSYWIEVGAKGVLANKEDNFFSKRDVLHPPAKERSFMRSALREMMPTIIAEMEATIASVIR